MRPVSYTHLAPSMGIIQQFLNLLGLADGPLRVLMESEAFPHLYVWSGVWQGMGWGSIVYLAALSGVDPTLHEAAVVDGEMCIRDRSIRRMP